MTSQEWLSKDYYKVLGLTKTATESEIRKAYRKLARKWHPDTNSGNKQAEEKFKEIGEAYSILSDKSQKEQYDAIRAMGGGAPRFSAGSGSGGGFEDIFANFNRSGGGAQYSNIFDFFGGGDTFTSSTGGYDPMSQFGRAESPRQSRFGVRPEPGKDTRAATTLTFKQALNGATVSLKIGDKPLKVRIPAGVSDGKRIVLRGKGQKGTNGGPDGDLVITVKVKPHAYLTQRGNDLILPLPVTFEEAVLGAQVEVPLPSGGTEKVTLNPGTQNDSEIVLKGKGAQTATPGDLIVVVKVVVPEKLSVAAREALREYAEAVKGESPRENLAEQVKL